jgi:hypothetical protein
MVLAGCSHLTAPQRTVEKFLKRLSDGNISSAEKLTVDGALNMDRRAREVYEPFFSSMEYVVGSAETKGDISDVSVTVTMTSLELVFLEAGSDVMRYMLSGENDGDDYYYDRILELLEDPEAPVVSLSGTARVVEGRDGWRIDLSAAGGFAYAITSEMPQIIGY